MKPRLRIVRFDSSEWQAKYDQLFQIAKAGQYDIQKPKGIYSPRTGLGYWLEWHQGSHLPNPDYDWGSVFKPFEPFKLAQSVFPISPHLKATFLELSIQYTEDYAWPGSHHFKFDALKSEYYKVAAQFSKDGKVDASRITELKARRDATAEELHRIADFISDVFKRIRNVLAVWLLETDYACMGTRDIEVLRGKNYDVSEDQRRMLGTAYSRMERLWDNIIRGANFIEYPMQGKLLQELVTHDATPEILVSSTEEALRYYIKQRDSYMDLALKLERKRWVLDWLVASITVHGRFFKIGAVIPSTNQEKLVSQKQIADARTLLDCFSLIRKKYPLHIYKSFSKTRIGEELDRLFELPIKSDGQVRSGEAILKSAERLVSEHFQSYERYGDFTKYAGFFEKHSNEISALAEKNKVEPTPKRSDKLDK